MPTALAWLGAAAALALGAVVVLLVTGQQERAGDPRGSRPVATIGAGVTTKAQQAAVDGEHGLKLIWGPMTLPEGGSAFPTYNRLGVDVLQVQLSWRATAPERPRDARNPRDPAYAWPAELTAAVRGARQARIRLAILVRQTPGWANGGKAQQFAPDQPEDFGDFLHAAAQRYPSVRHWMIWGEPTREGNFEPMPANRRTGPRRYAELLDAAYGALKRASPRNIVIGGNTWSLGRVTPVDFVRWMRLPSGQPPRLDYYGHNPYTTRFPDIRRKPYFKGLIDISDVDTLHDLLRRAYGAERTPKLWLSEFSIATSRNRGFNFFVSPRQQARWLTAAYAIAASQQYIAGLGWYKLTDEPPSADGAITTGLLTAGGDEKPAFDAYKAVK